MRDLGSLGGTIGLGNAINEAGRSRKQKGQTTPKKSEECGQCREESRWSRDHERCRSEAAVTAYEGEVDCEE